MASWLKDVFAHLAPETTKDESQHENEGSNGEDEAENEEEVFYDIKEVHKVKYFRKSSKRDAGWYALIEWEGDDEQTWEPFKNLTPIACKCLVFKLLLLYAVPT